MTSPVRFKINDLLEVRLENNDSVIYVAGKRFIICKKLLLNIPVDEVEDYEEIDSIDDVADLLKWDVQEGQKGVKYEISPEAEFLGHSSNLQVFYEYNYDTRLLHSNIAFPLLKELFSAGDLQAKKVFREEIAKRYESGNETVKRYLKNEGYLQYLDKNQLDSIHVDSTTRYRTDQNRGRQGGVRNEIQKRIETLQLSVRLLEDHLRVYGHLIKNKPRAFIVNQIETYKRELEIRGAYPSD